MLKRLDNSPAETVEIELDGKQVTVPAGIPVAAAMFLSDAVPFRTSIVSASPRAPFCMMGVCFECLVEIDGKHAQRACQVEVKPGMRITRQLPGECID